MTRVPNWAPHPLNFQPWRPQNWDPRGVAYREQDGTLALEVLPAFAPFPAHMHLRTFMASDSFPVGENGFSVGVEMAVNCLGTEQNPFGLDPGDPRLAAGSLNLVDFDHGTIFAFFVSNSRIWALHERLPEAATETDLFPSYAIFLPTAIVTSPGEWHRYEMHYDGQRNAASLWCDGQKVFEKENVGSPIGRQHPVARIRNITLCAGTCVVLDDLRNDLSVPNDNPRIPGFVKHDEIAAFGQGAKSRYRGFFLR